MVDIGFLSKIVHGDEVEKVLEGLAHHAPHILHALEKQYGDDLRDHISEIIENGTSAIVEGVDGVVHNIKDLINSLL